MCFLVCTSRICSGRSPYANNAPSLEITVAAAGILVQRMSTEYADEELLQIFMQTALECLGSSRQ